MVKIAVLGAGSWGTILANLLVENKHDVSLWAHNQMRVDEINTKHTNSHYLSDFALNKKLRATTDLKESIKGAEVILFVIPTQAIRQVANQVLELMDETKKPVIITASKGLEEGSYKRISQVLEETIPAQKRKEIVVLSGPSHAEDVAARDITTLTVASSSLEQAEFIQDIFMNDYFRLYTNTDVIGVEMGAALKNVIAIGAGALAGLGYGDNTKAALITRGLAEISRLGVYLGADPLTFIGLSGVGDLIVTATSIHSRNWRCGNALGHGEKLADILKDMGMVVEGVTTCKAAYELSEKTNIDMPITHSIYQVLYENKKPTDTIAKLMKRSGKPEINYVVKTR